jgi:Ser/Thr protein kinase RdoA (MazF antagonist)
MTQPLAVPPTDPAHPDGALPGAGPSEAVLFEAEAGPSEAVLFEIVGGGATAEEIAALTAVLAAMAAAGRRSAVPARSPVRVSGWAERSRLVRRPLARAPGAWRASARPS